MYAFGLSNHETGLVKFRRSLLILLCGLLGAAGRSRADDDLFAEQIAPIFQQHCVHCHNDSDRQGDLSLQTPAGLAAEGYAQQDDSGVSHLLELITPVDGHAEMPKQAEPLSEQQIAAIRTWIDQGAKWPADVRIEPNRR